jgi:histidine triad (HIT) family protein
MLGCYEACLQASTFPGIQAFQQKRRLSRMNDVCIFCDIVNRKMETEFLFENETVVVFKDIHPHAPVHILIVPKRHIRSINDLTVDDGPLLSELIMTGKAMADKIGVAKSGYKLLFNVEKGGGQMIFHLHLHLLGGWKR